MEIKSVKSIDFHFKMDTIMKQELEKLALFKSAGSFSCAIASILLLLREKTGNEHFFGKQRGSEYQYVHIDPAIKRESVHVYLPVSLYRELKMIHNDLNFYSIAQMVRWLLRFFLDLVRRYGDKSLQYLQNILKNLQKKNNTLRLTPEKVRQLSGLFLENHQNEALISIYDISFCPIRYLRI